MVHILGRQLPDNYFTRFALTKFYGVGDHLARRIMAKHAIYDRARLRHLSPLQVTALTAFLSAPRSSPLTVREPLAKPGFMPPEPWITVSTLKHAGPLLAPPPPAPEDEEVPTEMKRREDPLRYMRVEGELKREMRENIAHQRMIGSYVGKRHAMGMPVRGQNTRSNAKTAKKLNRIERSR